MIAQDSDNPYQDAIDSINTRNSSQKNEHWILLISNPRPYVQKVGPNPYTSTDY